MTSYYENETQFRFGFGDITWGVQRLILLTTGVFAAQLLIDIPIGNPTLRDPPGGIVVLEYLAFSPEGVVNWFIWQPLTYIFLHGGLYHLFMNMLILFFFGPEVERALGTRQFLWFYVLCGAAGVLLNFVPIILWNAPTALIVGASGACLGVLVAFAVLRPEGQVYLFPIPIPIPVVFLVFLIVVINIISALGGGSNTSVATHFGGMITGFVLMKVRPKITAWRLKRPPRARRRRPKKAPPEDEERLAKAIDNIFKLHNRDREK